MNIPNMLTVSRLVLAPVFFIIYFLPEWTGGNAALFTWVLAAVYLVIELTDLLDGYIARRYNLVTDIGKVMDPFADVFSRITYFVCFTVSGIMPAWVFLIILYRELSVTFLRMIMMKRGTAMAASVFGKIKAVIYAASSFLGICYIALIRLDILASWVSPLFSVLQAVFILGAAASLFSLSGYLRAAFSPSHENKRK